jgi:hypothetical protein
MSAAVEAAACCAGGISVPVQPCAGGTLHSLYCVCARATTADATFHSWTLFSSIWTCLMVYLVAHLPDPFSASTVQQQLQCHSVLHTQAV